MSFVFKLKESSFLKALKSFLFGKEEKPDLIQLWTLYRDTRPFQSIVNTGFFPKPSENGWEGQQKGIYFWNQKGGPKAWMINGVEGVACFPVVLMASTVLTQDQLAWPNWKVDAYIHADLLTLFLAEQAQKLWERQGHDVVYPIGEKYQVTNHFKYGDDDTDHYLVHSVSVNKDGIYVYDEAESYIPDKNDPQTLCPGFTHKRIEEYKVGSSKFDGRAGTLEKAIDCLCRADPTFRADYNTLLQSLPYEQGLKSVKYCAEEALPIAVLRSSILGVYSEVQYTNPLYQDVTGAIMGEKVGDRFKGRIATDLPEAYKTGTGYSESRISPHEWDKVVSHMRALRDI